MGRRSKAARSTDDRLIEDGRQVTSSVTPEHSLSRRIVMLPDEPVVAASSASSPRVRMARVINHVHLATTRFHPSMFAKH